MSAIGDFIFEAGIVEGLSVQEVFRRKCAHFYGLILAIIIGVTFTLMSLWQFEGLFHIPLAGTVTFGIAYIFTRLGAHKFIKFYMAIMPVFYSNWYAAYFADGSTIPFVAVNLLNISFYVWTLVLFNIKTERKTIFFAYLIQAIISMTFMQYSPLFVPSAGVNTTLLQFGWVAPLTIFASLFFVISGSILCGVLYSKSDSTSAELAEKKLQTEAAVAV
ncbi:hypothetical protein [Persicobacter psychrovividus]|uniref:Uncharacterized protein n=1 Tax=Persicobacter psychrovividus TaxID=387638 RepID=A0ABM7VE43_9BACT|nr:hypothetical protein PEPS_15090 [Persicobacter psychrovividus]